MKKNLLSVRWVAYGISCCSTLALLPGCGKATPEPVIAATSSNVTKSSTGVTLQTGKNSAGSTTSTTTTGGTTTGGTTTGGTTTGGTTTGGGTTISSDGNGGVAVGASGTIVFTLNGATYTLTNNNTTYLTGATYNAASGSVTKDFTLIVGSDISGGNGISFSLSANATATGVSDASLIYVELANGTSYTTALGANAVAKVNFNTYSRDKNDNVTTKGTFDAILINDKNSTDILRVSGSFNLP